MTDRYTILGKLAEGGMASVHLARSVGSGGFRRLVAIKRLRAELATDKDFVAMLLDEARVTAQIRHTNVVDTLDFIAIDGVLSLVLEYVEGDALHAIVRQARRLGERVPLPIVIGLLRGILLGLEAAHNTRADDGTPLGIVHRDISPQNVLVGVDGVPRIIDFGIAKAMGRTFATRPGEVRGKFSYMAPEQLLGHPATRQVDVYAAGVVFWELLAGQKLFTAEDVRQICAAVLRGQIPKPSSIAPDIPPDLDDIALRATAHSVGTRYLSAQEFLDDIAGQEAASAEEIGAWVRRLSADRLAKRSELVQNASSVQDGAPIDDVLQASASSSPSENLIGRTYTSQRSALSPFEAPPSLRAEEIGTSMTVRATVSMSPWTRAKPAVAALLTTLALGLGWAGLRHEAALRRAPASQAQAAEASLRSAEDLPGEGSTPAEEGALGSEILREPPSSDGTDVPHASELSEAPVEGCAEGPDEPLPASPVRSDDDEPRALPVTSTVRPVRVKHTPHPRVAPTTTAHAASARPVVAPANSKKPDPRSFR